MALPPEALILQGVRCINNLSYYIIFFDGTASNTSPIFSYLNAANNCNYTIVGDSVTLYINGALILPYDESAGQLNVIACNIYNGDVYAYSYSTPEGMEFISLIFQSKKGFCDANNPLDKQVTWNDIQNKPNFGTLATKSKVDLKTDVTGELQMTQAPNGASAYYTASEFCNKFIVGLAYPAEITNLLRGAMSSGSYRPNSLDTGPVDVYIAGFSADGTSADNPGVTGVPGVAPYDILLQGMAYDGNSNFNVIVHVFDSNKDIYIGLLRDQTRLVFKKITTTEV